MAGSKNTLPGPAQALPGRTTPLAVPVAHYVNRHRIVPPFPAGMQEAVFGMGCFWGAEKLFWKLPGVYATAVGYAGGHTPNPNYQEVCSGLTGHTEVVKVIFDPTITSYEDLLQTFWESHNPTEGMRQGNDIGTQYRSAIYTNGPEQQNLAERVPRAFPGPIERCTTRIHYHRNCPRTAVLLRRGLSPAVSGEESGWLLPESLVRDSV